MTEELGGSITKRNMPEIWWSIGGRIHTYPERGRPRPHRAKNAFLFMRTGKYMLLLAGCPRAGAGDFTVGGHLPGHIKGGVAMSAGGTPGFFDVAVAPPPADQVVIILAARGVSAVVNGANSNAGETGGSSFIGMFRRDDRFFDGIFFDGTFVDRSFHNGLRCHFGWFTTGTDSAAGVGGDRLRRQSPGEEGIVLFRGRRSADHKLLVASLCVRRGARSKSYQRQE